MYLRFVDLDAVIGVEVSEDGGKANLEVVLGKISTKTKGTVKVDFLASKFTNSVIVVDS